MLLSGTVSDNHDVVCSRTISYGISMNLLTENSHAHNDHTHTRLLVLLMRNLATDYFDNQRYMCSSSIKHKSIEEM